MAYRFKLQEPIAQEVRRVALEQIDIAEEKLASKDDVASAIHDASCVRHLAMASTAANPNAWPVPAGCSLARAMCTSCA